MKEVKVTKVSENIRRYPGKNGETYIHEVYIEGDPAPWQYHSLKMVCEKLQPQQMAWVEMKEEQNGQYLNRKITPANKLETRAFGKGGFVKDVKDQGCITALSVFSSVMNGLKGGPKALDKVTIKDLCEFGFEWAKSKSDSK